MSSICLVFTGTLRSNSWDQQSRSTESETKRGSGRNIPAVGNRRSDHLIFSRDKGKCVIPLLLVQAILSKCINAGKEEGVNEVSLLMVGPLHMTVTVPSPATLPLGGSRASLAIGLSVAGG